MFTAVTFQLLSVVEFRFRGVAIKVDRSPGDRSEILRFLACACAKIEAIVNLRYLFATLSFPFVRV